MTALLESLARFAHRRYRWVLAAFLVLAVASGLLATRLTLDTDVLALLPKQDPQIAAFVDALDRFGSNEELMVVVRLPEDPVLPPYLAFAEELARRLEAVESIGEVEYRVGSPPELIRRFFPQGLLFLEADELDRLEDRLSEEGLRSRAQELRRLLATPHGGFLKDILLLDPFGLADLLLGRMQPAGRSQMESDLESGYYLSADRRMLLLFARPIQPPHDLAFTEELMAEARRVVRETREDWPRSRGPDAGSERGLDLGEVQPPPEVELGGGYPTALEDARFVREDLELGVPVAFGAVLALFLFAFRRLEPLVFAFLPLACGLLLTFAFATLTLGSLSSATSGTGALLIGLGIDFVIVSYGRYVEERRQDAEVEDALVTMARTSGRAVIVGAVTTAATFFAFLVTGFRGLWEMGLLTGGGILLTMVTVLLLLPALLTWNARRHERREGKGKGRPGFYLHGFGVEGLVGACQRHPRPVLAGAALATVGAALLLPRLHFEGGMEALRPEGNRGAEVARQVAEAMGTDLGTMMLVIRGDSWQGVMEKVSRATAGARELRQEGVLSGATSATSLLPPPERQEAALAWIAEHRDDLVSPDRLERELGEALAAEGLRIEPFREGLDLFVQAVSPTQPLTPEALLREPTTRRLLERLLQSTGDGWISVVQLQPQGEGWRRRVPPELQRLAEDLGEGVTLTGGNVLAQRMRERVTGDAWLAGILGLVAVVLLLWLDFRSLGDTVLALVPLGVGLVWMLAALVLLGIDLNFLNTFVTTMILGIGVDYGLHVVHRGREAGEDLAAQLPETGKAVLLAALSTVCGFGSLALSHYPGLRSTGQVAILGALLSALVAVTVLPAWYGRRRG